MREIVEAGIREAVRVKEELLRDSETLARMARIIVDCIRGGGKVVFFGNGGSAADAQHLAAELAGRFYLDRPALPALSLSTNSSTITAIGNDYGFEHIFARQLPGVGARGDVAVAISTSGNSPNVIEAIRLARSIGMITFAWTGRGGGELAGLADYVLRIDSEQSPRIQEAHILSGHILCEIAERELFG
jgi:D-sedoheptulose 7-phosphate isomerase